MKQLMFLLLCSFFYHFGNGNLMSSNESIGEQYNLISKTEYSEKTPEKKKEEWLKRIDAILSLKNLPDNQRKLTLKLKSEVKSMPKGKFYLSARIKSLGTELANVTPEKDFLRLWTNLDNKIIYTGDGRPSSLISAEIAAHPSMGDNPPSGPSDLEAPDCDCRWFCGMSDGICLIEISYCDGTNEGNCCIKRSGCGFLRMMDCEYTVIAVDC